MFWPASTRLLTASRTTLALSLSIAAIRPGVALVHPLLFGQVSSKLGGILGDKHKPYVMYVREHFRDGRAARHHPGLEPALRQGAKQVEQDGVIPIPGVQQGVEQALVVCCC